MRILVTGGAGFIGSHVVDRCVADGHTVVVIDNLSTGQLSNLNPGIAAFYELDIQDASRIDAVFATHEPEVVSHQAALANVRESLDEPLRYAATNLLGSLVLLEAARRHGCTHFIYASTGGAVYGEPQFLPVTEDHPVNPLDPYGASKHAVEHYLFLYRHNYQLTYTILRYPNVYGPRQDPYGEAGVVAIFTAAMLSGRPVTIHGSGDQQRDFLYVGDVAEANALAAAQRTSGIFNLGTGVGTSINQLFAELQAVTGYTYTPHYGPAKPGEVFQIYADARKARHELGWAPQVTLRAGLQKVADSFAQTYQPG